jgi:hypothetical protein
MMEEKTMKNDVPEIIKKMGPRVNPPDLWGVVHNLCPIEHEIDPVPRFESDSKFHVMTTIPSNDVLFWALKFKTKELSLQFHNHKSAEIFFDAISQNLELSPDCAPLIKIESIDWGSNGGDIRLMYSGPEVVASAEKGIWDWVQTVIQEATHETDT